MAGIIGEKPLKIPLLLAGLFERRLLPELADGSGQGMHIASRFVIASKQAG
jgi:hypothetical protein